MINSHNSQQFLYVQDAFPERSLCYSPNLQHILSELGKNGRLRSNNNGSNKSQANLKKSIDELGSVTKKESAQNNAQKKMIVKPRNDVTVTLDFVREPIPNTTISNNSTVSTSTSTKSISVLAQKLLTSGQSENAFGKDYSFVCGKGVPNPIHLKIFFPSSQDPKKPLPVIVKRDATVEQVIGYSLYVYIEEKRMPPIDANSKLDKVACWNLRIVEDDGDIDQDFPALVRVRKIQQFQFDQFAVCPANSTQAKVNEEAQKAAAAASALASAVGPSTGSSSTGSVQGKKPTYFIKVHLYSTLEVKQTTTVSLPGDMLLADVLVYCCRKRKIEPNDYTLKMADTKTDVPLDRTLESMGLTELCLLKKDRGPSAGDIFLRPPEELERDDDDFQQPAYISDEYTSVYKKYTVTRKLHLQMMLGTSGRAQERTLAIDGDFIYLMPPESRGAVFGLGRGESMKTLSFHISNVISCKQIKRASPVFKLTISLTNNASSSNNPSIPNSTASSLATGSGQGMGGSGGSGTAGEGRTLRDRDVKVYEFEAQSTQEAHEICSKIHFMSQFNKGSLRRGI